MQEKLEKNVTFCWGDLIPQTGEFRLTLAIHRVLTGLRVTVIWYSHYRPARLLNHKVWTDKMIKIFTQIIVCLYDWNNVLGIAAMYLQINT